MTIHTDYRRQRYIAKCDTCGDEVEFEMDEYDFMEVVSAIQRDRWATHRVNDAWVHKCIDCIPELRT